MGVDDGDDPMGTWRCGCGHNSMDHARLTDAAGMATTDLPVHEVRW